MSPAVKIGYSKKKNGRRKQSTLINKRNMSSDTQNTDTSDNDAPLSRLLWDRAIEDIHTDPSVENTSNLNQNHEMLSFQNNTIESIQMKPSVENTLNPDQFINNEMMPSNGFDYVKKKSDLSKEEIKERRRLKKERKLRRIQRRQTNSKFRYNKRKNKFYEYRNGKKVFCQSDSESSDFEKYTYFNEGKTKCKVKLHPDIPIEDLEKQIRQIKMENICLMKEHERINQIKLKERVKLRVELRRLKDEILDLQLRGHLKSNMPPDIGNTTSLINAFRQHLQTFDYSKILEKEAIGLKTILNNFSFTDNQFWKDFNSTECSVQRVPYWTGNLDNITLDSSLSCFVPSEEVWKKLEHLMDDYSYGEFIQTTKNSDSKTNKGTVENPIETALLTAAVSNLSENHPCKEDNKELSNNEDRIRNGFSDKEMQEEKRDEQTELKRGDDDTIEEASDGAVYDSDLDQNEIEIDVSVKNEEKANEESVLCSECGHSSDWSSFIQRHRNAYSEGVKLSSCNTCNMRFLKSGHFDGKHRLKRARPTKFREQQFVCEECGQRCTSNSGLIQHRQKHSQPAHTCPHCSYSCRRKGYLKKHIETHNRKPPASEETAEQILPQHRPSFSCDLCQHLTDSPVSLRQHRAKAHASKKSFPCTQCPYIASKAGVLTKHTRTHTKERPYECSYCDYRSFCKSYLKSHVRYHTGHKPYKCDACPYACVTSTRLKLHSKVHTGVRDHACTLCDYRTTTSYNLKMHLKTHEAKVVTCKVCGFSCVGVNDLRAHTTTHGQPSNDVNRTM